MCNPRITRAVRCDTARRADPSVRGERRANTRTTPPLYATITDPAGSSPLAGALFLDHTSQPPPSSSHTSRFLFFLVVRNPLRLSSASPPNPETPPSSSSSVLGSSSVVRRQVDQVGGQSIVTSRFSSRDSGQLIWSPLSTSNSSTSFPASHSAGGLQSSSGASRLRFGQ